MSITKRILFGAGAAWFSRGSQILLGLILLPVLFRTLPKEKLGIWLLLGQSWAAMGILDLGFGVTLTRRIAFAKAKSGIGLDAPLTGEARQEIADLVATGLRIYRALAVVAFAVSFGAGFFYLRTLTLDKASLATVWTAWGILCLSQALIVGATPWTYLLQGVGYIGWDAILVSFVNAITLIGQIAAALLGGGVVTLATVAAIGALAQRATILGFSRRKRPDLLSTERDLAAGRVQEHGASSPSRMVNRARLGHDSLHGSDHYYLDGRRCCAPRLSCGVGVGP